MPKSICILAKETLAEEYSVIGLSDHDIASRHRTSARTVCRLRSLYSIQTDKRYQLRRNPLRHEVLSNKQLEFLYGSLLGDSCIGRHKSGTGYWICTHAARQEQYLRSKANIMRPFTAKIWTGSRPFKEGGPLFPYVRARTYALPQFTALRQELYPGGKKTMTEEWFRKITPAGFAFWFLDDGSSTGYGFDITTFDEFFKDIDRTVDLFRTVLDLDVSVHWHGKEGRIHVLRSSHDKAWEYVRSEMTSDMWHKIPRRYHEHPCHQT